MQTVGMIGLGIMGSARAANLVKARYRVVGDGVLASRRRWLGGAAARIPAPCAPCWRGWRSTGAQGCARASAVAVDEEEGYYYARPAQGRE